MVTGLDIAKYFKYTLQFKQNYIINKQPLNRIQCIGFYNTYKKFFDGLSNIFEKYNLNVYNYIDFFILSYSKNEQHIKTELINKKTMFQYQNYLFQQDKNKKIYNWFEKSVENISNDCVENDFFNIKDYIRYLIDNRKLADYYITGKISKYWLCGIPNFKKIISKLDNLSKDEFNEVYQKFDIYNTEINQAFLYIKNCKVNPIQITEQRIFEKRKNKYNIND